MLALILKPVKIGVKKVREMLLRGGVCDIPKPVQKRTLPTIVVCCREEQEFAGKLDAAFSVFEVREVLEGCLWPQLRVVLLGLEW